MERPIQFLKIESKEGGDMVDQELIEKRLFNLFVNKSGHELYIEILELIENIQIDASNTSYIRSCDFIEKLQQVVKDSGWNNSTLSNMIERERTCIKE